MKKKNGWQAWEEDWKRHMLVVTGKGERWDNWAGAQEDFESLDLMTEGIKIEKLLWFVAETEMEDLGVVGILGPENVEWKKERLEADFAK